MSDEILLRLKFALQALASPAKIQIQLFPSFVIKADELALEFDRWYRCVKDSELQTEQKIALFEIDTELERMSHQKKLWSEAALHTSFEWQKIRELAHRALHTFDWELQTPPGFHDEYVSSKPR